MTRKKGCPSSACSRKSIPLVKSRGANQSSSVLRSCVLARCWRTLSTMLASFPGTVLCLIWSSGTPSLGRKRSLSWPPDEVPERPGPPASVDRPAGAKRRQRLGVSPTEAQAFLCQRIQVGGLYLVVAVDPDVIFPETVQDHQYDVHFSYPRMA